MVTEAAASSATAPPPPPPPPPPPSTLAGVPRTASPRPYHADEARGKPQERMSVPGEAWRQQGCCSRTRQTGARQWRGAEGHDPDQGHSAHGQREAPVEAPQDSGRRGRGPGPSQAGRPGQQWGRRDGCPWGPHQGSRFSPHPHPRHGTQHRRLSFLSCINGACTTPEGQAPGAVVTYSGITAARGSPALLRSPLAGTDSQVHFGKCP